MSYHNKISAFDAKRTSSFYSDLRIISEFNTRSSILMSHTFKVCQRPQILLKILANIGMMTRVWMKNICRIKTVSTE